MLTVEVKVNGHVIAHAKLVNCSLDSEPFDAQNYFGAGETDAFSPYYESSKRPLKVQGHDRRKNVWTLVEKIAQQMK